MFSADAALGTLQSTFGFSDFRSPQAEVITSLAAGRDVLLIMPTGGGKSLCYQLPALLADGVTVVISPLIALMQDQVLAAREFGIAAASLSSADSPAAQRDTEEAFRDGTLRLLYLAPERLQNPATLALLKSGRIALVAVDEAHCVSQWGHNFRPDYLALELFKTEFPDTPLIALTATADETTRNEVIDRLRIPDADVYVKGFDRPNLYYEVRARQQGRAELLRFLEAHKGQSGIVYCLSRKKVEQTAAALVDAGYDALAYHAGMSTADRSHHQARFQKDDAVIIVATIAFGMGIDKPDVRFVVHTDMPKSIEAYYQETGRAGRDGDPADVLLLFGLQDIVTLKQMSQNDGDGSQQRIESLKLDSMLAFCEVTTCRRQVLLGYFGETRETPCGHCDNCVTPREMVDRTEDVQKILSAIYRTGQRFGANYVIDVLRGGGDERIARLGHDQLSVYGIGASVPEVEWRSIIRQLVVRGYVRVDLPGYGALQLEPGCRAVLRGEEAVMLAREQPRAAAPRRRSRPEVTDLIYDERVFEGLRELRTAIAREGGVPPYVIFHDRTLKEMSAVLPDSMAAMAEIGGVGAAKLERYGERFLECLRELTRDFTPDD